MKTSILFHLLLLMGMVAFGQSNSLYDIEIPSISEKNSIKLSDYRGKKILVVNIASLSEYAPQCIALEQLAKQFKDSNLVVLACPSNDFGGEPNRNETIRKTFNSRYQVSFPLSGRINVKGDALHPLFSWLTKKEENGVMNIKIRSDFQKILINADGKIIGSFSASISPMDEVVLRTIRNN